MFVVNSRLDFYRSLTRRCAVQTNYWAILADKILMSQTMSEIPLFLQVQEEAREDYIQILKNAACAKEITLTEADEAYNSASKHYLMFSINVSVYRRYLLVFLKQYLKYFCALLSLKKGNKANSVQGTVICHIGEINFTAILNNGGKVMSIQCDTDQEFVCLAIKKFCQAYTPY